MPRLHREDVAVAAAADVVEILHAPRARRVAVEGAALGRARAAVDHVVVGDHDDFVGRREAVDAERVELALGAHHDAVVDHDEVGRGKDHVAGPHRRATAA